MDSRSITPEMKEASPFLAAFKGLSRKTVEEKRKYEELVPVDYEELLDVYERGTGWKVSQEELRFANSWGFTRVRSPFSVLSKLLLIYRS